MARIQELKYGAQVRVASPCPLLSPCSGPKLDSTGAQAQQAGLYVSLKCAGLASSGGLLLTLSSLGPPSTQSSVTHPCPLSLGVQV